MATSDLLEIENRTFFKQNEQKHFSLKISFFLLKSQSLIHLCNEMIAWKVIYFHLETSFYSPLNGAKELAALSRLRRKHIGGQAVDPCAPVPGSGKGRIQQKACTWTWDSPSLMLWWLEPAAQVPRDGFHLSAAFPAGEWIRDGTEQNRTEKSVVMFSRQTQKERNQF